VVDDVGTGVVEAGDLLARAGSLKPLKSGGWVM
jgi:hypothetical protein